MTEENKCGAFVIGISDTDEKICAASGRISTQKGSALEIFEKSQDKDKNASLISKVTSSGHTSTLEHCFYNLAFSQVSVVVEQFMIEFRLASFTVQSRRYVDFSDCGYYVHEFKDEKVKEKYIKHMDHLFSMYDSLIADGISKEDARFVLPYCFKSNFFCSLNARELINVLKSMIYGRGSKYPEIKKIGISLLSQCRELTPGVFINFEKRNENTKDSIDLSFVEPEGEFSKDDDTVLLSYTPDAHKVIAKAALIENTAYSLSQIEKITEDESCNRAIIKEVLTSSRPRALEQASFSFKLSGVSLACLTHFARHRMHGIMIPDLNTVNRKSYILPPRVAENDEIREKYEACFKKNNEFYEELKNNSEVDENDLIYILLAGNTIDIVSSMNARELLLFFKLRSCTRAQWEIQNHANKMLSELRKVSPVLFENYGPSCFSTGRCPEGKFSCGRISEMKEKFGK